MPDFEKEFQNILQPMYQKHKHFDVPDRAMLIHSISDTVRRKASEEFWKLINTPSLFFDFLNIHLESLDTEKLFLLAYNIEDAWHEHDIEDKLFFFFKQFEYSKEIHEPNF